MPGPYRSFFGLILVVLFVSPCRLLQEILIQVEVDEVLHLPRLKGKVEKLPQVVDYLESVSKESSEGRERTTILVSKLDVEHFPITEQTLYRRRFIQGLVWHGCGRRRSRVRFPLVFDCAAQLEIVRRPYVRNL